MSTFYEIEYYTAMRIIYNVDCNYKYHSTKNKESIEIVGQS
jgi:hypothetical protein